MPVPTTWSHNDYKNFSVSVKLPAGEKVLETYRPDKNNSAPQMLILSEDWLWPIEKKSIADAYLRFSEWTADHEKNDWVKDPEPKMVVNRE